MKQFNRTSKINECDCGGGCDCGAGGGISTGDVLGNCDHQSGQGFLGPGCFHVPFPAMPTTVRYGWSSGTGKKKKKYKNGLNYDNPYVGKIKTIVGENEPLVTDGSKYLGSALKEFQMVVADQNPVYTGVLYFNRDLSLAWLVQKNGILVMFKPIPNEHGGFTIYKTYLHSTGNIILVDRIGQYESENAALTEIWHMSQKHKDLLAEFLEKNNCNESNDPARAKKFLDKACKNLWDACENIEQAVFAGCSAAKSVLNNAKRLRDDADQVFENLNEARYSPRDIMNWEAHGRDPRFAPSARASSVNSRALELELAKRFPNQFDQVSLSDRHVPGRWTIEFKVSNMPENALKLTGQQRVRQAIPMIDRIMQFLRTRSVEINQYDISAVKS